MMLQLLRKKWKHFLCTNVSVRIIWSAAHKSREIAINVQCLCVRRHILCICRYVYPPLIFLGTSQDAEHRHTLAIHIFSPIIKTDKEGKMFLKQTRRHKRHLCCCLKVEVNLCSKTGKIFHASDRSLRNQFNSILILLQLSKNSNSQAAEGKKKNKQLSLFVEISSNKNPSWNKR